MPSEVGIRPERIGQPEASTPFGPRQFFHERSCASTRWSVENIEESVAVRLHQKMSERSAVFGIHQHGCFVRVIVVQVVGRELKIAISIFPVLKVDGQHARCVEVITRTGIANKIRARHCWSSNYTVSRSGS